MAKKATNPQTALSPTPELEDPQVQVLSVEQVEQMLKTDRIDVQESVDHYLAKWSESIEEALIVMGEKVGALEHQLTTRDAVAAPVPATNRTLYSAVLTAAINCSFANVGVSRDMKVMRTRANMALMIADAIMEQLDRPRENAVESGDVQSPADHPKQPLPSG